MKVDRGILDDALQSAARDLPEGWSIIVQIERGAGWVELYNADGARIDFENVDRDLHEQVAEALKVALAKEPSDE